MKAIILAAGAGTRLKPLSNTTPKPLISIYGKTILEHNLEFVYPYVDEIIIVVKYLSEKIQNFLGKTYKNIPISYHIQGEEKGTGGALMNFSISDDVVILNGDTIFSKDDIKKIVEFPGYGVLVQKVKHPEKYGIFQIDKQNNILKVIEKPGEFVGDLANLGVYKFSRKIFEIVKKIQISSRGEYELTDAINIFVKAETFVAIPISGIFLDIGHVWNILEANSYFLQGLEKSDIKGKIEEGVVIKGNIILEEGAILKSGTYIEGNCYIGKNTRIGPNTYLRGETCIGDNCHIGNAVEVKNSSIGNDTNIAHLSYVGDSVIGNNVNLGGGFMSANLRHDNANIKIMIKGKLVDIERRKFGVIIGDNVKTGVNTVTMPGRILENDTYTNPGDMIK